MKPHTTTVFSAELPGFSGLTKHIPPKEFNALLKECYEMADSTVRLHQGILSHFSGDAFMAVFNPEKSKPALLALDAMDEFNERLETFFRIKNCQRPLQFPKAGAIADKGFQRKPEGV